MGGFFILKGSLTDVVKGEDTLEHKQVAEKDFKSQFIEELLYVFQNLIADQTNSAHSELWEMAGLNKDTMWSFIRPKADKNVLLLHYSVFRFITNSATPLICFTFVPLACLATF